MTLTIKEVIKLIEQLITEHDQLLKLSKEKTELVKNNEMEALQKLLMRERKQVQKTDQLETKRMQAVDALFAEWHIEDKEKTVTVLLDHMEEGKTKQALEVAVASLIDRIVDIRQTEQLNKDLIEQSMQFVQLSLDMYRPTMQQMNYSPTMTSQSSGNISIFDSKA